MSATSISRSPVVIEGKVIRCPADKGPEGAEEIIGCGSLNVTEPDNEGIIDCLDCGIWFDVPEGLSYLERREAQNTDTK